MFRKNKKQTGVRWRLDDTYQKLKGQGKYLYRAVDKQGKTIDFRLAAKRDKKAAHRFLTNAIGSNGKPSLINIDKSGTNTAAIGRLFNEIVAGKCPPKYLSSDNDPLFLFHRWQANLRILEVDEIKSIPGVPTSHPFVERLIGTCRRECVDRSLFWNARDLQRKLLGFQKYYNETRVHSSLAMTTPNSKADECNASKNVVSLHDYRWRSHASELYHLPIAA